MVSTIGDMFEVEQSTFGKEDKEGFITSNDERYAATKLANGVYSFDFNNDNKTDILVTEDAKDTVSISSYVSQDAGHVVLDQDNVQDGKASSVNIDVGSKGIIIDNDTEWDGESNTAIAGANVNVSGNIGEDGITYDVDVTANGFDKSNVNVTKSDLSGNYWDNNNIDGYTTGETTLYSSRAKDHNVGSDMNISINGNNGGDDINVSGHVNSSLTTDTEGKGSVALQMKNVVNFNVGNSDVVDTASYENNFDITAPMSARYNAVLGEDWVTLNQLSDGAQQYFEDLSNPYHWKVPANAQEDHDMTDEDINLLSDASHLIMDNGDGTTTAYAHFDNFSHRFDHDGGTTTLDPLNSVNYNGSGNVDISGVSQVDKGILETDNSQGFISRNEITAGVGITLTGDDKTEQTSDIKLVHVGDDHNNTKFDDSSGNYIKGGGVNRSKNLEINNVKKYNSRNELGTENARDLLMKLLHLGMIPGLDNVALTEIHIDDIVSNEKFGSLSEQDQKY
ncbi:hypothetical protein ACFL4D_02660, partial [Candidatus Margulisiibacteriota bacterium]